MQREYRVALENMARLPPNQIFLVPIKLESDCSLPEASVDTIRFDDLQWFDLEGDGLDVLLRFLDEETTGRRDVENRSRERIMQVSAVPEFLDAIGSNRTLKLDAAVYLLRPEAIQAYQSDHIRIERVHDGWQLNIVGVENLRIEGVARDETQFLVNPQYAFVISLENCNNTTIQNLTMAHSPPGFCTGGVVKLAFCKNIIVKNCNLYGSGTVGLEIHQTDGLVVEESTVRHCTFGILTARGVTNARFFNVEFSENKEYFGLRIERSTNIAFENCNLTNNISMGSPLLDIHPDSVVTWKRGRIAGNRAKGLYLFPSSINFIDADTGGGNILGPTV